MSKSYAVLGLAETIYVGDRLEGSNCKFEFRDEIMKRHKIFARRGKRTVCVELYTEYEQSYSGWCEACVACVTCTDVEYPVRVPFTHVPKKPLEMEEVDDGLDEIQNEVFTFSRDGNDRYYPNGYYAIDWELFTETPRYKDKRVVYIVTGESGIGKTYLASQLEDMEVYETDSSVSLPERICTDVVVLGNRSGFTLEQVRERILGPAQIVVCSMTTDG